MIERNSREAVIPANAVGVLESARLDICQRVGNCQNCPLGRLYDTLDHNICIDMEQTASKLMLARRVVEKV